MLLFGDKHTEKQTQVKNITSLTGVIITENYAEHFNEDKPAVNNDICIHNNLTKLMKIAAVAGVVCLNRQNNKKSLWHF